ncbi:MAG: HDOD domain-containing protein [Pseudomonadota bacterium]
MDMDPKLLQIDIPARPEALVKLALLLAETDVNLQSLGTLIESDMALAAAVMKAVNSSLYGLKGRVQTVQQAVTYLGMREISAVTYEIGLRSVFPPAPELHSLWERASVRGLLMGRLAQALSMDAWSAHTAGLFEECGKAILFKHAKAVYQPLLASAANDAELVILEEQTFGTSHDVLGAKLCENWGLSAAAVASVQHHVRVNSLHQLPRSSGRSVCVLSGLANTLMTDPDRLEEVTQALAPQAMLDQTLLLRGARKVKDKIDDAMDDV